MGGQNQILRMPPFTIYTRSVNHALGDSMVNLKDQCVPCLFVIACRNYQGFAGFSIGNQAYSAYPAEQEVILNDDCNVKVLDVMHQYPLHSRSNDRSAPQNTPLFITIIHLFHCE